MTGEISEHEADPPLSSFKGRLDIHTFKFSAREQLEAQKIAIIPRSSKRLSSKIDTSFKPTKHDATSKTSSLRNKKRKVDDLQDNAPVRDTVKTKESLHGQTEMESSSSNSFKLAEDGQGSKTLFFERSERLAERFLERQLDH